MRYLLLILTGIALGVLIAISVEAYQSYRRRQSINEFMDSVKAHPVTLQSLIDAGVLRIDTIKNDNKSLAKEYREIQKMI